MRAETLCQPETPLVSVVIPCWNQARFLGEAIESVLRQTYGNTEIIVVDDGSEDKTSTVARSFPGVRCIGRKNGGLASARNTGLRESRGDNVIFLDADDRLLPIALEAGVNCLAQHPQCAFAAGDYRLIDGDGAPLPLTGWPRNRCDSYSAFLRGQSIAMGSTVIYRRCIFESITGFNQSLKACEDYDLYLRITRVFPICYHDEVVAEYRQHDGNMSRRPDLMLQSALTVMHFQRKFIRGRPDYVAAYKEGIRFWKNTCYGPQLCNELLDRLRQRRFDAAAILLALLRHNPRSLLTGLGRLVPGKWNQFTKPGLAPEEVTPRGLNDGKP